MYAVGSLDFLQRIDMRLKKCPVGLNCLTQGITYYNAFDCPYCGCQNVVGVLEKSNSQFEKYEEE